MLRIIDISGISVRLFKRLTLAVNVGLSAGVEAIFFHIFGGGHIRLLHLPDVPLVQGGQDH